MSPEKIVANANNPYVVRKKDMEHNFRFSQKDCETVMKEIENFLNFKATSTKV